MCFQRRFAQSRAVLVVLLWNFIVSATLTFPTKERWTWWLPYVVSSLLFSFAVVVAMTADLWLGRYRVMVWGTTIIWLGLIFNTLHYAVLSVPSHASQLVWYILLTVGEVLFLSNSIQFGADQLQESSSDQFSSFVHWFVFSGSFGKVVGTTLVCGLQSLFQHVHLSPSFTVEKATCLTFGIIMSFTFTLLLVCLHVFCSGDQRNLAKQRPSFASYKYVLAVMKYAFKHKEKALEYKIQPKLDVAKGKFGGPFRNDIVEDVKTLQRICLLLVVLNVLWTLVHSTFYEYGLLYQWSEKAELEIWTKLWHKGQSISSAVYVLFYQLVLVPFFRRYIPSILNRVFIASVCCFVSSISNLVVDLAGHMVTPNVPCIFTNNSEHNLNLQLYVLALPSIASFFSSVIMSTAVLEFLMAQTPCTMRGLVFGLRLSLIYISYTTGFAFTIPFHYYPRVYPLSCGSAYFLTNTVLGAGALIAFNATLCSYKYRKRDEEGLQQTIQACIL